MPSFPAVPEDKKELSSPWVVVCDRLILSATLFIIIFAPMAYGAVDAWAQTLVRSIVVLMLASWGLKVAYLRKLRPLLPPFWLPALLFAALLILQLTPLPTPWRISLSPEPLA